MVLNQLTISNQNKYDVTILKRRNGVKKWEKRLFLKSLVELENFFIAMQAITDTDLQIDQRLEEMISPENKNKEVMTMFSLFGENNIVENLKNSVSIYVTVFQLINSDCQGEQCNLVIKNVASSE